jgi:hypothetical protein
MILKALFALLLTCSVWAALITVAAASAASIYTTILFVAGDMAVGRWALQAAGCLVVAACAWAYVCWMVGD